MSEYPKELIEAQQLSSGGSISEAYAELIRNQQVPDTSGKPIGWPAILEKYHKYIKFCDSQNVEPKYRKHLSNWIKEKLFLNSYDVKGTKRSRVVQSWLKGLIKLFASW